jgi:Holliday junction DNA helicase RuvB
MREVIHKLNNILDSAISILEPNFEYSRETIDEKCDVTLNHYTTTLIATDTQEGLFQEIYGHENIKAILNMALRSGKPIHVLLTSPPGMAKTQFLLAIRNIFRGKSCFAIGSNSTKKGIIDLLFEKQPQILLIDELETMSHDTQESLLNLMETGIISETKKTCRREMYLKNIKVFATSNDTRDILSPLLSRFLVLKIPPYTDQQFIEIAVQRLTNDEEIPTALATEIAQQAKLKLNRKDLRDCIKIARIARTPDEIASVISMMN